MIFLKAGFKEAREYRYWSEKNKDLDFEGMIESLKSAPKDAVILLQGCGHNPTGCDPTNEQWEIIADIMEEGQLFPIFDVPYLGCASGDIEKDAWPVRYFASRGFEMFCCQSIGKLIGISSRYKYNTIASVSSIFLSMSFIPMLYIFSDYFILYFEVRCSSW